MFSYHHLLRLMLASSGMDSWVWLACTTLPFGWKIFPYIYHRPVASGYLRTCGIPFSLYIDDRLNGELLTCQVPWSGPEFWGRSCPRPSDSKFPITGHPRWVPSWIHRIHLPIFSQKKEVWGFRMILNLTELNRFIVYHHFKMENVESCVHWWNPCISWRPLTIQMLIFQYQSTLHIKIP